MNHFYNSAWKFSKASAFFLVSTLSLQNQIPCRKLQTLKSSVTDSPCSNQHEIPREILKPNGIFAVYKPKDWTSSDVVSKIRNTVSREIRQKTNQRVKIKCGHGGTLDPLATGVLVIGLGTGCKALGGYLKGTKSYNAIASLGKEMDTLDCTGEVIGTAPTDHVTWDVLNGALPKFRGDILQVPPMYSALKRDGKKLYELAREGKEIEREPRPVHIAKLDLLQELADVETGSVQKIELPHFGLGVECGGGTYIRSLISDIAKECKSMAYMTVLERTKQGPFTLKDCLKQEDWTLEKIRAVLVDPQDLQDTE